MKPRQFTDTAGRTWTVDIHPALLEKLSGGQGRLLLGGLVVQVLYTLLEDQIDEEGITPDEFAGGFGGDTLERALESIKAAFTDMLTSDQLSAVRELLTQLDGIDLATLLDSVAACDTSRTSETACRTQQHGGG